VSLPRGASLLVLSVKVAVRGRGERASSRLAADLLSPWEGTAQSALVPRLPASPRASARVRAGPGLNNEPMRVTLILPPAERLTADSMGGLPGEGFELRSLILTPFHTRSPLLWSRRTALKGSSNRRSKENAGRHLHRVLYLRAPPQGPARKKNGTTGMIAYTRITVSCIGRDCWHDSR